MFNSFGAWIKRPIVYDCRWVEIWYGLSMSEV